jgi:hypothetical protein
MGMPPRTKRVLIALGIAYAALTVALFFVTPGLPAGTFEVDLPRLDVPGGRLLRGVPRPLLLAVKEGRCEWRALYLPADGGPRVCPVINPVGIPRPVGDLLPSAILCADPDESWNHIENILLYPDPPWWGELWFATRSESGRIRAMPVLVGCEEFMRRKGLPPFYTSALPEISVRVTSSKSHVRYRWGWNHGDGSLGLGDVSVPRTAVDAGRVGELTPLRRLLGGIERFKRSRYRAVIRIATGTGTRYVDILRIVECAGGSPEFLTLFMPGHRNRPGDPRTPCYAVGLEARLLRERSRGGDEEHVILNVYPSGDVVIKRRCLDTPALRSHLAERPRSAHVLIRAADDAPWATTREVIREAFRNREGDVLLAFTTDPELPSEANLTLPPSPPRSAVDQEIDLTGTTGDVEMTRQRFGGKVVRLVAPGDMPTARVFRRILGLRNAGARIVLE